MEVQRHGLTLNAFEVVLNKQDVIINRTNFEYEKLKSFRVKFTDFYFYRIDEFIYSWEKRKTERTLPEEFEQVNVTFEEDAKVFAKIIETAIVELFFAANRKIFKRKYSSIWQLIVQGGKQQNLTDLSIIPVLNFSVHTLYSVNQKKQVIVLSINQRYQPRFVSSETDLNKKNIDTRDWDRNNHDEIVGSKRNVSKYIKATNQIKEFDTFYTDVLLEKNEYQNVLDYHRDFNIIRERLFLPNELKIVDFLLFDIPNSNFESLTINRPNYFFYNGRTGTGRYDIQTSELKPYSFDIFSGKKINILGLTLNTYQGSFENFVKRMEQNLKKLFYLDCNITIVTCDNYVNQINELDLDNYDLALLVLSQKDKDIDIASSPYFLTKAKLLNQKVPSQDILIERIRSMNDFILNNISLNSYSKIGGTAWTIEKDDKLRTELIIGIGSSMDLKANRIIGFANVFDYNGTFLVGDCSQISTSENYSSNLELHLKKIIRQVIQAKNIQKEDPIRLIFHLFKEAGKGTEIKAIENTLIDFADYDIQFCIAHLSYNHNLRLYNNCGNMSLMRGTYVQISTYQALLCLGGRTRTPILVRLDKRSTYKDLYSITKQILHFTHLSYRNFTPGSEPVTIKYPSLMAKLASELRQVQYWDPDIMNKMGGKLWFL